MGRTGRARKVAVAEMAPAWLTPLQLAAWAAGTDAADEAWANRPVRKLDDAPFWYTPAQKQRWVDEG